MSDVSCHNILFVDDEPEPIQQIIRSLERRQAPFLCHCAASEAEALSLQQKTSPPVAVVDLCLSQDSGPESGMALIGKLIGADPTIRVLVLTGHGADQYGIEALQAGAASFLTKPVNTDHLLALLSDGLDYALLKREHLQKQPSAENPFSSMGITSLSPQMIQLLQDAAFAASNSQSVLLLGETGTGKGLLARAIHKKSTRKNRPFVRFQPFFGSADLVSSELFGHERGAFTGAADSRRGLLEEASRGTLFIDEVGDLPLQTQVMMLEVLQEQTFRRVGSNRERQVNFRLISATNKELERCMNKEELRADFLHRIRHLQLRLIPLRERKEDIPALTRRFIDAAAAHEDLSVYSISDAALGELERHSWPGNIRELQTVVENSAYRAAYAGRRQIAKEDVQIIEPDHRRGNGSGSLREQVKAFEAQLVNQALEACSNNQSRAAELLKVDRSSLRRILQRS